MDTNELRVTTTELAGPKLDSLQKLAGGLLVAGLVLTAIGAFTTEQGLVGLLPSYLYAYLFWVGLTAGSLGLLMLHHTVGGGWGFVIRRMLEAGARPNMVLLMAGLFVPVLLGLLFGNLYSWVNPPEHLQEIVGKKTGYLNVPFFILRSVVYFVLWFAFSNALTKLGDTQDQRSDAAVSNKLNHIGAFGILIQVIIVTFASVDWVMSLTPDWYSSIFGLLLAATWVLGSLALMVALFAYLAGNTSLVRHLPDKYYRDLGNLLLALVMLWAYLSFSQYLIIFSGNVTEMVTWYEDRQSGFWPTVVGLLILFHFALPFLVLLKGDNVKRSPQRLAGVALFLVLMRFVDYYWWVVPTFRDVVNPADLGLPLLIGGLWLSVWISNLRNRPVVPLHDPRFEANLHEVVAHHG